MPCSRVLALACLAGCGGAREQTSSVWLEAPARPPTVARAPAPAAPRECVTFHDQELACQRECRDIRPRLRACFAASSAGSRIAHVAYRTTPDGVEDVAVVVSPREPIASQCVRDVFETYVPCVAQPAGEHQELSIPVRIGL